MWPGYEHRPAAPAGLLKSQVDSGGIVVAVARPDPVATGASARDLSSWLDAREQAQHAAFYFARDRKIYLAAHALMRAVLSECIGLPPRDLLIRKDRWGRPVWQGSDGAHKIHFSLSHTHGLVACAVCGWPEVGLDVEPLDRADVDTLALAGTFAVQERHSIESAAPHTRAATFFSYWTLKEAYSKARGLGLNLPFADFAFRKVNGRQPQIEFLSDSADDPRRWSFWLNMVGPSHVLALASGRPRPQRVIRYAWCPCGPTRAGLFHAMDDQDS